MLPMKRRPGLFLSFLPEAERTAVEQAVHGYGAKYTYAPSQVHSALELHKKTRIPLRMAFEAQLGLGKLPVQNQRAMGFLRNLQDKIEVKTKRGKVLVTPSFHSQTSPTTEKAQHYYGLHKFTMVSFRIAPAENLQRFAKFLTTFRQDDPWQYAMIVELGLATINKKPVVVVTNAQAIKQYYALPWELKKTFEGAYEKALEIASKASGGNPILIPSNKTVTALMETLFDHRPPTGVLDEFYDRFSEKRGRHKATVQIKNTTDGKKITTELWLPAKM